MWWSVVKRIVGVSVDVGLVGFAVWCLLWRPAQGPVRVVAKVGSTVACDFRVRPNVQVVSFHCWQGPELLDGSGYVWSVQYGFRRIVGRVGRL